jgi:hypothetical protein
MKLLRRSSWLFVVGLVLAFTAVSSGSASHWSVKSKSVTSVSGARNVSVADGGALKGYIRVKLDLPSSWKQIDKKRSSIVRFGPIGSCRFKVTLRPRLVQAVEQSADERVAEMLPASPAYVQAYGTRESAAFRAIRVKGTPEVRALLVQPLPTRSTPGVEPEKRIYAEVSATGIADPKQECHSGGPRSVADALADAFAAGSVGGFLNRPR